MKENLVTFVDSSYNIAWLPLHVALYISFPVTRLTISMLYMRDDALHEARLYNKCVQLVWFLCNINLTPGMRRFHLAAVDKKKKKSADFFPQLFYSLSHLIVYMKLSR